MCFFLLLFCFFGNKRFWNKCRMVYNVSEHRETVERRYRHCAERMLQPEYECNISECGCSDWAHWKCVVRACALFLFYVSLSLSCVMSGCWWWWCCLPLQLESTTTTLNTHTHTFCVSNMALWWVRPLHFSREEAERVCFCFVFLVAGLAVLYEISQQHFLNNNNNIGRAREWTA